MCLFKKDQLWLRIWDLYIIMTAIYTTIAGPIKIAWEAREPFGAWYEWMDGAIFICYIADIFIQLRTIYTDILGDEITDAKKIAVNYLLSFQFAIDILSLISNPFSARLPGESGKFIKLFSILKV